MASLLGRLWLQFALFAQQVSHLAQLDQMHQSLASVHHFMDDCSLSCTPGQICLFVAIKLENSEHKSYFRWITIKWFSLFCSWSVKISFVASDSCPGSKTFHLMMKKHSGPSAAGDSGVSSVASLNFQTDSQNHWSCCLHAGNMRWRTDLLKRADSERFVYSSAHKAAIVSELSKWVVCWGGWQVAAVAVSSIIQLLVFYLFIYLFY